jgi:hypothetical protein
LTEIDTPPAFLTDQIIETATAKLKAVDETAVQAPKVDDQSPDETNEPEPEPEPQPEPKVQAKPTQVFRRAPSMPPPTPQRSVSVGRAPSQPQAKLVARSKFPQPPDDRPVFKPRQPNGIARSREQQARRAEINNIRAAMVVYSQNGEPFRDYDQMLDTIRTTTEVDPLQEAEEIKQGLIRLKLATQDLNERGYPRLHLTKEGQRFVDQQLERIRQAAARRRS